MKLPIRTLGLATAALLSGSVLSPASAQQQQSGVDGQVAVRSDGALYLISNGQRRWVATVVATDEEINALPEGDPVFAGLAPAGSGSTTVATTKPSASSSPTSNSTPSPTPSSSSESSAGSKNSSAKPTPSKGDEDDGSDLSTDIPISVDISGSTSIKRGDSRAVEIKTKRDLTCELKIEIPNGDPIEEDSKNADSRGICKYTIEIPSEANEGSGKVIGTVRQGGNFNHQEIPIKIVKK